MQCADRKPVAPHTLSSAGASPRHRWLAICAAAIFVLTAGGCRKASEPPNFILISLDTLRAQSLGAYGYGRNTSPHFDALAVEGHLFENAITTSTTTAPAHMSIFSGLYPRNHGIRTGFEPHVARPATIAQKLRSRGYSTAAFTESGFMSLGNAFKQGFEIYHQEDPEGEHAAAGFAAETFSAAGQWLKAHRREPFFLFVHTYEVHFPYVPAEPYTALFQDDELVGTTPLERQRDLYDREIRYLDDRLAEFTELIRNTPNRRRTIVIVLSDHGEEFGEHGEFQHAENLHDEILRVPLLVWGPGLIKPGRTQTQVSLVDVAPTILELAGVPIPPQVDGVSLVPALHRNEEPPDRFLYAEAAAHRKWIGVWKIADANPYRVAIRSQSRKFIVHRPDGREPDQITAFDLQADPAEKSPIYLTPNELELADNLADGYFDGAPVPSAGAIDAKSLDPAMVERMRLLGYID